ncbi:MAG: restriction endonuclease [Anaerolineales bacterium]|nr:restriction endonuclease [Anaerolineales bacterium]
MKVTTSMDDQIKEVIKQTVLEMLTYSISRENILKIVKKHGNKVHFVPKRYRVIGGILQGLNIKFGNFIESLMRKVIEVDTEVEEMPDSGKKILLYFTPETDTLIDNYITSRQLPGSPDDCTPFFDELLEKIVEIENKSSDDSRQGIRKDVDALFRIKNGCLVYAELKYNDDHDTGKFADINRKFIKTWAGLAVRLKLSMADELIPILYYFNPIKRYGPIHIPARNIMRGEQLFDRFLQTSYYDVDKYLSEIGEDPEILQMFDDLYKRVRFGEIPGLD